ncbi:fimbria/pilus outer membrane usher protein [Dryocola clanedunensis]|uniref:fimbria/pilus outer membrane usher protein n=1 Tax=Cedecea sulfonylureivorans TaxID=3051154 RepID=UPI0019268641|nr:fimbria/pilus outer membrane usher protein [Cedecea sulfonylureivorans]
MLRLSVPLLVLFCSLILPASAWAADKTWIILNNAFKGAISLTFYQGSPCLTRPLLEEWGIRPNVLKRLSFSEQGCLTKASAERFGFQSWYRESAGLLTLLLPEEALAPQENGVTTSRWDDGIPALFTNYRLDADKKSAQYSWEKAGTDATLDLDNGLNIGAWRLRYQNTFWRDRTNNHGSYTRSASLWRSIRSLRSRMTLGDGTTSSAMFDGFSFRGASLASDEAMYPDSWRPSSPWITGYARSEAEVTIHQNGQRVYRLHVQPGAFTIQDFYPPDPQGDLELTVQESDGTERTRILPWSVMPNLTGQGIVSYELAAGRYKPYHGTESDRDRFAQSTFSWGAAPGTTLFAGWQQGDDYISQVAGVGQNFYALGALSADLSHAQYTQQGVKSRGMVWRLRYTKAFFTTQTHLNAQLQGYPHGSQYRTFEEKINRADTLRYGWDDDTTSRAMRGQLEINQSFNEDSTLAISWNWTRSRQRHASDQSLSLSLNTRWQEIDISLAVDRNQYQEYPAETVMGLNISVPFSAARHTVNVGYVSELDSRNSATHGVNLYGSALSDYSLRYDVTAQHQEHANDELRMTTGYQYNAGEANLGLTRNGRQRDYHADMSGSLMLHSGGLTAGQQLGETVALVDVPQTPGVSFYNQFGTTTNARGELLVSYLTPWRVNELTVDTSSLPANVHFDNDELEVVPTQGAVVRRSFLPASP